MVDYMKKEQQLIGNEQQIGKLNNFSSKKI